MDRALLMHFAQAIYSLSKEENKVDEVYKDLTFVNDVLSSNKDSLLFLASPTIDYDKKNELLKKHFSNIDRNVFAFLTIVIKKHQIKYFSYIVDNYLKLSNIDKNILQGLLYTPFELDKDTISRLNEVFSKKYNKQVILKMIIDKKLIGGLKVLINDTLYDYSIENKIEVIKNNLSFKKSL